MSLSDLLRLLARKWPLLVLVPLVLGISTYYFGRNLPKTYRSDTTIYTGIASGYSLKGDAGADYNSTNNAFDNLVNLITARSTKQEVSYQLLATHLWQTSQQPSLLATPAYESLRESLPAELRRQLTGPTREATLENVRRYAQANTTNPVYQLQNSANPTYSLTALSALTATRIASSDLVRIEFDSYDPEICRYTLELVTQVFLDESKNLREGQTETVIGYYEKELDRAKARLAKAESENLAFNRDNNIINYEAQSKDVASEKEALASEMTQVSQQYAGAQAALDAVTRKLGGREAALLSSREVVAQRQKLSRLNAAIADQQLFNQQAEGGTVAKTRQLQAEAERAAQEIQDNMDSYYAHSTSTEGIPKKELLGEWVQDMVLVESNRAKLNVMTRRLQEFDREYQRMAPLGATLKRIEREIELAEKNYLSLLANLNASKATQQNTQLTSKLKIIDPPNLPLRPKTSKLLVLVLLSAAGGFVFAAGLVAGLGMLDKSLKKPSIAARTIGLPVAGVMYDEQAKPVQQLAAAKQRSLGQLVRHILMLANTPPAPQPFVVGVFSVQRQEGKTTLCQALAQRCHDMGVQALALYPDDSAMSEAGTVPSLFYPAETAAVQGWQLEQLIQNAIPKQVTEVSTPDVQLVFVEFPALREEALPVGLLRQLNLVFLTVPATRAWRLSDHETVERLRAATPAPVEVVLSNVAPHYAEEALA
jgi:uncharacterized protein involved in exopolysaccharide biosynthesis